MEYKYDPVRKAFLTYDDEGNETGGYIKFRFEDTYNGDKFYEEPLAGFTFSLFYKPGIKEAEDFAFLINKTHKSKLKRAGWIIPLATLVTEDDTIQENPHLSCYAFHAYQHLLSLPDFDNVMSIDAFQEVIGNEKYSNACLVITYNQHYPDSDLKRLELVLARYGFYKSPIENKNPRLNAIENNTIEFIPAKDIVNAQGDYIDPYIDELMLTHLNEKNPVIRFLYLYQVIEVLMNQILVIELQKLIKDLNGPTGSIHEVSDVLKNKTEIARWQKIEENAGIKAKNYKTFRKACVKFLKTDKQLSHPDSIYKVRNHVTHRFRLAANRKPEISVINDYFERYLWDLLCAYREK